MAYTGLSNLSPDVASQVVHVRISRLWHHRGGTEGGRIKSIQMVLIDVQANQMQAIVPYPISRQLVDILHEGNVYEISRYLLVFPRPILRPVEATYAMILGASATVKRNEGNIDDFPTWSYSLTSFAELPLPDETPERFVDVIGTIFAISDLVVSEVPGRTVDVARRNVYITDPSTEQRIKIVLWGDYAYRFNGNTVKFLGQTESAIAIFVDTTVRDYDGQRGLAGGTACRWYINDDIPEINILRVRLLDHYVSVADCPISTAAALRAQIGEYPRKSVTEIINFNLFENQNARFCCNVRVLGFTPNHRCFGAFCTRCRRSSSPHPDFPLHESYMCSGPHCDCESTILSYQIAFVGTDGSDEAEFILRGQMGQRVIRMSTLQLTETNWPPKSPRCNSFRAAGRIRFPSPQFAAIISNRYKFIVGIRSKAPCIKLSVGIGFYTPCLCLVPDQADALGALLEYFVTSYYNPGCTLLSLSTPSSVKTAIALRTRTVALGSKVRRPLFQYVEDREKATKLGDRVLSKTGDLAETDEVFPQLMKDTLVDSEYCTGPAPLPATKKRKSQSAESMTSTSAKEAKP